jgi:hypothetical protein
VYSGWAYATEITGPALLSSGRQAIIYLPCIGSDGKDLTASILQTNVAGVVDSGQAVSTVNGGVNATGPISRSTHRIEHLSIGPSGSPVLSADAIESTATTQGAATGVASSGTVNVVNLVVAGQTFNGPLPANQTITIPGVGYIRLNETTCVAGHVPTNSCTDSSYSAINVIAVHVVVTITNALLPKGLDLRVAVAHSDLHV